MLKQLVARETGYTEDLLGDDTDLESDLGIDSIKRLEILVTACEWVRVELAHGSAAARQVARGFRTLGAMAEWLEKKKLPEIARPVSAV
jgi:acyl carrier protein